MALRFCSSYHKVFIKVKYGKRRNAFFLAPNNGRHLDQHPNKDEAGDWEKTRELEKPEGCPQSWEPKRPVNTGSHKLLLSWPDHKPSPLCLEVLFTC